MRISRRCPSLRRYFRPRFGFRTFLVSLAAVYFTAMYVFQSGLNGAPPRHDDPPPAKRWDAGGADDGLRQREQQQRRRLPVERIDNDLQAAFDNIRQLDRRRKRVHEVRDDALDNLPPATPDVNVPASCNSSAAERRRRGDDFIELAGVYLLSAFWDERPNDFDNRHNGTLIRVMTVVREAARNVKLACAFGLRRTPLAFYEMCENHHRPYGSFILSCRIPDDIVEAPCFVTVVAESARNGDSGVDVPVRTLKPQSISHSFSVCVPPLFGDLPPDKLIEFFELTLLLGADHIVIYDWTTSPNTRRVIGYYAARCRDGRRCRVDVIDWRLPEKIVDSIWYNGQSLAIQDCLYRQMASSRYVVFNDIDEFLVPHDRQLTNWTQLARSLDSPLRCGFQFLSAFFDPAAAPAPSKPHPPVKGDLRRPPSVPDLMTMRATSRSQHFSSVRTKCMVRPYEIFEAGIHHISKPIWAHLTVDRVGTEVAVLHHYRKCVALYGMSCAGTVDDLTIRRYIDDLARSTAEVWNELVKVL